MALVVASSLQLRDLRRRVYSKDPTAIATLEDLAQRDWARLGYVGLAILFLFFFVVTPPQLILETLSGRVSSSGLGGSSVRAVLYSAIALLGAPTLVWWFIRKYDPNEPLQILAAVVLGTVVANIYIAFGLWIVATEGIQVDVPSREVGLMFWWNLLDSIPLIDIDSMLDWERPIDEYGADLGWLLLTQRLVLYLTLARSLQMILDRARSSAQANSEAGADE